jgi:hypothetical protein
MEKYVQEADKSSHLEETKSLFFETATKISSEDF